MEVYRPTYEKSLEILEETETEGRVEREVIEILNDLSFERPLMRVGPGHSYSIKYNPDGRSYTVEGKLPFGYEIEAELEEGVA